ncbi:MAG: hypothetical protein V3V75_05385, partial [Thermoguttaceae bacterium]
SGFVSAALPIAPDLPNVMSLIWRLPGKDVFQAGSLNGHPRLHADLKGNGQSTDPTDYSHANP